MGYSQIQRSLSNDPYRHDQPGASALSRFEARAQEQPDTVALIFEDQRLTFGELNARANQVAHYLTTLGVKPETYVAICLERSLELVVGILAILKAGGVYVPVDPRYPRERTLFMLQDANARILLTQESLAATWHEHAEQVIRLDTDWSNISQFSGENLPNQVDGDNLAYIIYTSGSSGLPKGVMITHNCLSHYLGSMKEALGLTANDVYLHTASFAFSSSVRQLMVPLAHGAAVTIASTEQILNPLMLFDQIKRHGVTIIDIVPSYWRNLTQVLASLPHEQRSTLLDNDLRLIVSASEALVSDIPAVWSTELKPEVTLRNMCGQTETTGIVSTYPIPDADGSTIQVVPIGRPIANMQLHILDDDFQPVSGSNTGQLYVSGPGLGRGYLNRPDLTAEQFLPNPFSGTAGDRLYTSGDLARYLASGDVRYVGRADEQVKLRGYRVELREIEAILAQHPAVSQSVVVARGDTGEQRLVGYVVAQTKTAVGELAQAGVTASELYRHLRARLPEYMVPSVIMMLDALPLTANGKVDRRALPEPDRRSLGSPIEYVAPRTPTEEMLANIFGDVLQMRTVGIHDNFFELGGHSLLGTQVLSRVREAIGVELVLRTFFEAPTVALLCERIDAAKNAGQELIPDRIPRIAGEDLEL